MKPEFETDYNKRIYQVYNAARSLPEDTKRLWMDEISKYISNNSNLTFLDLGSGTGRFSSLIADHFTCNVIGIEPSEKMLETAHSSNRNPNVKFTKGDAYNIPEADSFFSFAWLSMVIHHIADKDRCAKELSRVLRKDGLIFIRNSFKHNLPDVCYYKYFPKAFEVDMKRLPSTEQLVDIFSKHSFSFEAATTLQQLMDNSFTDHIERIRKKALSTFEFLTEEEFEQGIKRMEEASHKIDNSLPVYENIDLLVFRHI